jgi:hypothetical protein
MPKYKVYLLSPIVEWEGITAKDKEEAIDKCEIPYFSPGPAEGPFAYHAVEENEPQ